MKRSSDHPLNYIAPDVYVGSTGEDAYRGLFKFDPLPTLSSSDYIIDARLYLATFSNSTANNGVQVDLHKLTAYVDTTKAMWDDVDNKYDPTITDYQFYNSDGLSFDITKLATDWYHGQNYGLMLNVHDETQNNGIIKFASSDIDLENQSQRPTCVINFRNTTGLENYWSYHSESIGRATKTYVNDATGELTMQHVDFSENGNRMPIVLNRTFNMSNSRKEVEAGVRSGIGWQMNINQYIRWQDIDGTKYAVYTDADGTIHYFSADWGWYDEDGLGLKLEFNQDDYQITNKSGTIMRFKEVGDKIYLYAVDDTNGNCISINYSSGDYNKPDSLTDGADRVTKLSYNAQGRLSTITDPANRVTNFEYAAGTPGADPRYLQKVIYPDGEYTAFSYIYSEIDNHITVMSSDGTSIIYDMNGNYKTYNATAIGTDGEEQNLYTIETKSSNVTRYTYSNGLYEDYQFDNYARLTCVKNNEGYAKYSKYTNTLGVNNNKTSLASNIQKSVSNYFINGNAEESRPDLWYQESWDANTGGTAQRVNSVALQGSYSWQITKPISNGYYHNRQYFDLEKNKTYTFSAYIKTDIVSSNSDAGAKIYVNYYNNDGSQTNVYSVAVQNTGDEWQRVSVTFTNQNYANRVYFFIGVTPGASGTAYFDNLQVEDGDVMNRYNCIENGSFERGSYNVECNGNTEFVSNNGLNDAGKTAFRVYGDSQLSNNDAKINVYLNMPANTNIVVGAWARANAAPMSGYDIEQNGKVKDNNRLFGIEAEINYTDGSSYMQCLKFNDALSVNDWQYISGVINLSYEGNPSLNKTVAYIRLNTIYKGQVNYADFDLLSMYVEEFGQSFSYDNNGNLKSSADIAKQSETFDYSNNNNLTKISNPTGSSFEYMYDSKKNLKGAVNSEGVRCQFNYDNFGNPISSVIQSDVQSTSVSDGNIYYIRNKLSGKYLDSAQGTYNGKNVIQTSFAKSGSQMWKAVSTGDGYFKFVPVNAPEYALDVVCSNPGNGTNIQLCEQKNVDAQKFKVKVNSGEDGSCAILTKATNGVGGLDVTDALTTDGANVAEWTYGENGIYSNQVWFFEEVPQSESVYTPVDAATELNGKVVYLYNKNSNKVIQVSNNVDQNGALVKQYDKKIDSGMKWRIKSAGGGYVYLVSMCSTSGRVLGVPDTNSLTSVQLRNNDGSDLVKFKIIKHENGTYEILNKASNKCLAVYGDQQANDGNIVQNPYNMSGVDREWYIQSGSYEWSDVPTVNKNYYIESSYNSKFFDIPTKRNDAGAPLTQYSFNGEDNQKFKLVDCGSGYFKIQPLHSSDEKVLELSIVGSSYNLIINTSGSSYLQQFKFVKNSNGTYKIVNRQAGDGYVIEIPNSSNTLSDPLKMAYNTGAPGQNQQWVLKAISDMITSSATYNPNSNYNYLASTTDSKGKTTNYNYDVTKGTLESVTNANSVATNYTYDKNNDSLTAVAQSGVRVGYTYNKDKLSTITTGNNNVYSFGFDNFNRNTTVKIGSQTLITNIFNKRGLLSQSTYGNSQTLGYTYDLLDRVTEKKYNGEVKATYTYDNGGNVVRSTDKFVNTTTNNIFDVTNRLMVTSISRNNLIIQNIKFKYDDKNRVSDYTNTVAGVSTKTAFNYSNTSQINGVCSSQGNVTLSQNYSYDNLDRIKSKKISLIDYHGYTTSYTYLKGSKPGTTTNLIELVEDDFNNYKYEYDNLGNITKKYKNDNLTDSYSYDNLNQLKTETRGSVTITYNYDFGGNITSKTTTSSTGTSTINYTYSNTNWKDLLTNYNDQNITYDAIGNPLTYGNATTFKWQNGRRLTNLSKGSTNASYIYNADGIRTQKKVNGVTTDFYLNGSNIVTQIKGSDRLDFMYDETGNLYGFIYKNIPYAYIRNTQNDIIGIVDNYSDDKVYYQYDAWGNLVNMIDSTSEGIGTLNPFRYRGYYFDSESGLFYVGSRYYNPEWGRFINADGLVSTGQGLQGNNMFAYCGNNPVNYVDPTGQRSINLIKVNPADMVAAYDYNQQTGESIAVNCSELIDSGFENVTIESTIDLNLTLRENNIQSKLEIVNFLAQCAYESDWGSGLTERGSDAYFAGKSYGKKYRGAGYIQCTGAANYQAFANAVGNPEIYNQGADYVAANYAWAAAGWWWNQAGMNSRINSGYTVNNVSGMVTAWDKNAPDNGSYIDRVNNYNKIYGILR